MSEKMGIFHLPLSEHADVSIDQYGVMGFHMAGMRQPIFTLGRKETLALIALLGETWETLIRQIEHGQEGSEV